MQPQLSQTFDTAFLYAATLHRNQSKGTGVPYLGHLIGVCSLVLGYGADEEIAIAALLHDALEDGPDNTGIPRSTIEQEIADQFGPKVLEIVKACTDTDIDHTQPGQQQEDWLTRKQRYVVHMSQATDPDYLLVTACDKLHNLRAIWQDKAIVGEKAWTRVSGGRDGSLWYYRELGRVMKSLADVDRIPTVLVMEYLELLDKLD
ncbi:MAG: HD domain-containing protein [Cyanophyceae cyanobacterium]|jgi:(p)ppGpp synthase/HD superfamily hydrolase